MSAEQSMALKVMNQILGKGKATKSTGSRQKREQKLE